MGCLFCLCFFVMSLVCLFSVFVFFFKQKTAYEMRISDWSSDVCSSDLQRKCVFREGRRPPHADARLLPQRPDPADGDRACAQARHRSGRTGDLAGGTGGFPADVPDGQRGGGDSGGIGRALELRDRRNDADAAKRTEEQTSELQSLMPNSYAVLCFQK